LKDNLTVRFIADLHVHSKFSRATAKDLDLEHLHISAQLKGISVVATGDFTHPGWIAEIREKLIPAEPGLFKLKDEIARDCDRQVPPSCGGDVRFILETEISNIYKKNGKTRKNHNLIFAPDIETAQRLNAKLDALGNIKSDGRPILGLDAKNLLSIMLDCSPDCFLIPAHIWTPWFSLFGSKSGFDSIHECFEDLSSEIFALETGLSSDAPMNWRVSELDAYTLVSNSDSHSPANLGRNANLFDTDLSFSGIRSALKSKDPARCLGTLDMYPEEGKYHLDGHRKCNLWQRPSESLKTNGVCPVCKTPLTLGVLHRVEALADRPEGFLPENGLPCYHLIPLAEILSEIFNTGTKSKTVNAHYQTALELLGPELGILQTLPIADINQASIPFLSEAIRRMRAGEIHIFPGYDGEYGKIRVFDSGEKEKLSGQESLFLSSTHRKKKKKDTPVFQKKQPEIISEIDLLHESNPELNTEQRQAVEHVGSPLLIVAGPGAGKTRTLTYRIAYLIKERKIAAENILGITFTNRAAREMRERLQSLPDMAQVPIICTFHSLCFDMLKAHGKADYSVIDEEDQAALMKEAVRRIGKSVNLKPDTLLNQISTAKQNFLAPDDDLTSVAGENAPILSQIYRAYQDLLAEEKVYDYDDLIFNAVRLLESDDELRAEYSKRFQHILVDEYQDVNPGQYRMIRALAPPDKELCVIGDPDQSIYGFRGSDVKYFQTFTSDYPTTAVIRLNRNYRSVETILEASHQMIFRHSLNPFGIRAYSGINGVKTLSILEMATEKAEAVAIGKLIENMVGGTGFHSIDFGKTKESGIETDRAFSDFAVLYRSHAQSAVIAEIFETAGIPYQIASREHIWQQKGISELISLLKITENKGISADIQKIAKIKGADRVSEFREKTGKKSVREKLEFLLNQTELRRIIKESSKREDALDKLLKTADIFRHDVSAFMNGIALETDPDSFDIHAQKVALMTLHAAKGLEFPVVFIVGCEDGYLPSDRSSDEDEERRLLYVGMTRAKEQLFLSYAKKRMIYGRVLQRSISPFVKAIEDRLMTREKAEMKKPKKEKQLQAGLF
jgi:uncharacterized protein (TIGR00375 family)